MDDRLLVSETANELVDMAERDMMAVKELLAGIYYPADLKYNIMGTSKNRLFLEVPLQFLALWAAKRAFFNGKSLKTEVFRDSLICFHVTQAVEKFLKGYIINTGKTIEKTHDLNVLLFAILETDNTFIKINNECTLLNTFIPNIKYNSRNQITKQDMDKIIKSLETVCCFPPIKSMRDLFSKKYHYQIIHEITANKQEAAAHD
ncbi:MAG: HEPN domain-containing protein [Spirochaetaceae bacterium]|jgi:HEPN domain-containing protein|nr:HEPN domain-containing protein [Spirochaetaceae bacterium]